MSIEFRRELALAVFMLLLAAAFIATPAWQLLEYGPFSWHVRQPAYWQGGLEALALVGILAGTCARGRRAPVIGAIALLLYLRHHAVDAALLLDVLYIEIVVGLGAFARRAFGLPAPRDAQDYLHAFVLGFVGWSLLAWSASALDAGSIRQLRWLTLLAGVPALFGRHRPFTLFLWDGLRARAPGERAWCGAITAWLAVLYARSNVAIGYDSLWYGLRPEYVLDPHHSVFEPLGLTSPVHYYPKLYEVFLLPLSALGDSSTVACLSIWMLALTLLACHQIGRRIGVPARVALPMLATIATLPALASVSIEPKPDAISVAFLLLAANAAFAFLETRSLADALWMLVCAAFAGLAKLSAVPFAGALVLATLLAAARGRVAPVVVDPVAERRRSALAIAATVAAAIVAGFVIARTWLLTGMPTVGPDVLFRSWRALGMTLKEPAGTLNWTEPQVWSDVPMLIVDWLFRPQTMPHVVTAWVGNVWAWLALSSAAAAMAGARRERRVAYGPLVGLIAAGLVLALGARYGVRGSDGNYFLGALLPATIVAAAATFARLAEARRVFAVALACLPVFALFQAAYSFASASWVTGTRPFDLDLTRSWKDSRRERWERLQYAGLETIGRYLKEQDGLTRSVGYVAEPVSFLLPSRFEYLPTISYSRPEYFATPEQFAAFLRAQRIDYLILPQPSLRKATFTLSPSVLAVAERLQGDPSVKRVDDRDYFLLDLSKRGAD
ncbi:hypothetical protein FHW12_001969 [Dokdonella fugitiva]|uniref:4-amino-4-deoxy-L-arabinose transferase-like glycosyltransferase n=1 Tax=Dokdonella fugitiva TaxID=328517 RepID=A0A839EVI5_9GAMM|nr:hypothetical protein [Dokdonella fugitiva]MBA8887755.1 hypothetical protein [Dokdonella fugitiva]